MSIIKGGRIPSAVYDAKVEADGLVARAHEQAAVILAEAEGVREQARRAGRLEGFEAGRAEAAGVIAAALAEAARVRADSAGELVTLAVRMAERIVGQELLLSPGAIAGVAREALASARGAREAVVRVNPEDLPALEAARPALAAALASVKEIVVRADVGIARGGCVVDTEAGTIDARLEVQLAAFEKAILGSGAGSGTGGEA